MAVYKAKPEYIRRAEDPRLYDLEDAVKQAIEAVANHRHENRGEAYWQEAIPQTLKTILESYDTKAATVAAKSFLSGKEETLE